MISLVWQAAKAFAGGLSPRMWLIIAAVTLAALWSGYCYRAGYSAADSLWRARNLEAQIARLKADLAANEKIRKEAEADAAKSEENEIKLKELIDALQNDKSCPLSRQHIDGLRRIDESP